MEVEVKVSGSASSMNIIEEVGDNKFIVSVNPSTAYLAVEIDGVSKGGTTCTGLQS